ncbi:MAG: anti-sigma factor antagonist [Bacillota bacterium]
MNIKIEINKLGDQTMVSVAGEIDAYTAPKLRETLLPFAEESNPNLTVNLKNVSYMDSTGLGVFVSMLKIVRNNDGQLALVELSDRLERLFSITGLCDIMDISSESEGGVQ